MQCRNRLARQWSRFSLLLALLVTATALRALPVADYDQRLEKLQQQSLILPDDLAPADSTSQDLLVLLKLDDALAIELAEVTIVDPGTGVSRQQPLGSILHDSQGRYSAFARIPLSAVPTELHLRAVVQKEQERISVEIPLLLRNPEHIRELEWQIDQRWTGGLRNNVAMWHEQLGFSLWRSIQALWPFGVVVKHKHLQHDRAAPPSAQIFAARCATEPLSNLILLLQHTDPTRLSGEHLELLATCAQITGYQGVAVAATLQWAETPYAPKRQARFAAELAQRDYAHGRMERALQLLHSGNTNLDGEESAKAQLLQALVVMEQGHFAQAAKLLAEGSHMHPGAMLRDFAGEAASLHAFMRINSAIALLHSGNRELGLSLLDTVGRSVPLDADSAALRDRANAMLGYEFLRSGKGPTASAVFGRMHLNGPYANQALLGQGWAFFAGPGVWQARAPIEFTGLTLDRPPEYVLATLHRVGEISCDEYRSASHDDFARCASPRDFEQTEIPESEDEQARLALYYWLQLLQRDPKDFTAIEGRIAAADALHKLGEYRRASELYRNTLDAIARQKKAIQKDITAMRTPEMARFLSQPTATVQDAPEALSTTGLWQLQAWLSSRPVHACREILRELQRLDQESLLQAQYRTGLHRLRGEILAALASAAQSVLLEADLNLDQYDVAARFMLARSLDFAAQTPTATELAPER